MKSLCFYRSTSNGCKHLIAQPEAWASPSWIAIPYQDPQNLTSNQNVQLNPPIYTGRWASIHSSFSSEKNPIIGVRRLFRANALQSGAPKASRPDCYRRLNQLKSSSETGDKYHLMGPMLYGICSHSPV